MKTLIFEKNPLDRNIEPKPVTDITKDFTGENKETKPPKIIGLIDIRCKRSGLIFFNKKKNLNNCEHIHKKTTAIPLKFYTMSF